MIDKLPGLVKASQKLVRKISMACEFTLAQNGCEKLAIPLVVAQRVNVYRVRKDKVYTTYLKFK